MPNILFISYDGMTDPLGQSQVLPYLKGLSAHDLNFILISFEKKVNYAKRRDRIQSLCKDSGIVWAPLRYTKYPPVLATVFDYFRMLSTAMKLCRKQKIQVVHCRSYIAALVGLKLKRKLGVKFIFDMRGFWADERVDGDLWNLRNPIYKLVYKYFKKKEKEFISKSDKIISLTRAAKYEMQRWNVQGLFPDKIVVIPCAADYEHFELISNEKRIRAKQALGFKPTDFVLIYVGSIGTWYLLDEMVRFFNVLRHHMLNAKFLILTPDDRNVITRELEKYRINFKDVLITFTERSKLPQTAHAADLSLFFIKPAYSKISSSPTKMGEILAMGIPIICNDRVGDVEDILKTTEGGFCIKDFSANTFNTIVNKISVGQHYDHQGIREKSRSIFDLKIGISSYLETYKYLLSKP